MTERSIREVRCSSLLTPLNYKTSLLEVSVFIVTLGVIIDHIIILASKSLRRMGLLTDIKVQSLVMSH